MWMRLPLGRPLRYIAREWPKTDSDDMRPTTAYLWDRVPPPPTRLHHGPTSSSAMSWMNWFLLVWVLLFLSMYCMILFKINVMNMLYLQVTWGHTRSQSSFSYEQAMDWTQCVLVMRVCGPRNVHTSSTMSWSITFMKGWYDISNWSNQSDCRPCPPQLTSIGNSSIVYEIDLISFISLS
jgi:hypothetical protein